MKPCLDCGIPSPDTRCPEHTRDTAKPSADARGYDWSWRKLSERARRLQPWCSDCYTTDDLTTDHSEAAWKRKAAGKAIRLRDVDVVCRPCNARRGRARPQGEHTEPKRPRPADKAQGRKLTPDKSEPGPCGLESGNACPARTHSDSRYT